MKDLEIVQGRRQVHVLPSLTMMMMMIVKYFGLAWFQMGTQDLAASFKGHLKVPSPILPTAKTSADGLLTRRPNEV